MDINRATEQIADFQYREGVPTEVFGVWQERVVLTKERVLARGRKKIREVAIENAKKRIALSSRTAKSLTSEEREAIVAEEEFKLKEKLKQGSLVALLVFFGLH